MFPKLDIRTETIQSNYFLLEYMKYRQGLSFFFKSASRLIFSNCLRFDDFNGKRNINNFISWRILLAFSPVSDVVFRILFLFYFICYRDSTKTELPTSLTAIFKGFWSNDKKIVSGSQETETVKDPLSPRHPIILSGDLLFSCSCQKFHAAQDITF